MQRSNNLNSPRGKGRWLCRLVEAEENAAIMLLSSHTLMLRFLPRKREEGVCEEDAVKGWKHCKNMVLFSPKMLQTSANQRGDGRKRLPAGAEAGVEVQQAKMHPKHPKAM